MRKRTIFTAVAAAGLIALPATASAYANPTPGDPGDGNLDHDHLEELFDDLANTEIEAVIAEARYGDDVWTGAAGDSDLSGFVPADPTDRVRVASITKSMVGVIGLQLQEEGVLDLDDNVSDHLPDLLPYDEEITLRQLLNHTSGMTDALNGHLYTNVFLNGEWEELEELKWLYLDPEDQLDIIGDDGLLFEPGESWAYSNTGYAVFGMVIEELTGNDIADEFEQRVFKPAGMDTSYQPGLHEFLLRGSSLGAYVHTGDEDQQYVDTSVMSLSQLWVAGSVVSNPHDINSLYRSMADGTLLSAEQYEEALDFVDLGGDGYGLGVSSTYFGCPSLEGGFAIGHGGGGLGHESTSLHSIDGEKQFTLTYNTNDVLIDNEGAHESIMGMAIVTLCGDDVRPDEVDELAAELTQEALQNKTSVLNLK